MGTSESVTSVFHQDDALLTQQKGGLLQLWQLSNAGYQLATSIDTEHTGFCRIECITDEQIIISPKAENSIVIVDHDNVGMVHATLVPAATATTLGQLMCFKYIDLAGQGYVLAGYESGDFLTWDLRTNRVIDQKRLEECPMAMDYDPVTNRGIYGGPSDRLGVFAYATKTTELQKRGDIALKNAGINCVAIRRDQKVFSAGGWDGKIRIFSWKSLRPLAVLTEHKSAVTDISYSGDKVSLWKAPIMAASGLDGQISLWDLYN